MAPSKYNKAIKFVATLSLGFIPNFWLLSRSILKERKNIKPNAIVISYKFWTVFLTSGSFILKFKKENIPWSVSKSSNFPSYCPLKT